MILDPSQMQSHLILAPVQTHWRRATCEEVRCLPFLLGFATQVDETTELGQRQAHYIRHDRARPKPAEDRMGDITVFSYPPGTPCFDRGAHRTRNNRPEVFAVRDGDHRGNPRQTPAYIHDNAENWVDDLYHHTSKIIEIKQRG